MQVRCYPQCIRKNKGIQENIFSRLLLGRSQLTAALLEKFNLISMGSVDQWIKFTNLLEFARKRDFCQKLNVVITNFCKICLQIPISLRNVYRLTNLN